MRWFSFILILLAATLLEAGGLLNIFAVGGWYIRPGVLITLLVYYAAVSRPHEAIWQAFLIGLAADLVAGTMGPHLLCYGVLGTLLNSMGQALTFKRALHKALFVFAVYSVSAWIAYWLGLLKTHAPQPDIARLILLGALYSAVVSPLIWSILAVLTSWTETGSSASHRAYH